MAYSVEADNSFADFTELETEVAAWFTDQSESEGRTGPIADWDVQLVDSLYKLFNDKEGFNEDISAWDIQRVTNMGYTFNNAKAFNADISAWDVSSATTMDYALDGTSALDACTKDAIAHADKWKSSTLFTANSYDWENEVAEYKAADCTVCAFSTTTTNTGYTTRMLCTDCDTSFIVNAAGDTCVSGCSTGESGVVDTDKQCTVCTVTNAATYGSDCAVATCDSGFHSTDSGTSCTVCT